VTSEAVTATLSAHGEATIDLTQYVLFQKLNRSRGMQQFYMEPKIVVEATKAKALLEMGCKVVGFLGGILNNGHEGRFVAFIFKKFYSLYELKAIQLEGVEGGPRPLIQGLRRLQRLRECFEG